MKTPVCDFVKEYAEKKLIRLHMPGHKGRTFIGPEKLDITEIDGADVLYQADGIIKQSEENAATLFGSRSTFYSAEGSSLAIRAMLYLALIYAKIQGARPLIAAGRNAHKVFMTAAALLDFDIEWLYPEKSENLISCKISPLSLDSFLKKTNEKPSAVYITSPDYLGNTADIEGLSAVCRKYGVLLLVDNAHGAYLNFLPVSRHPMALGADMCCDSAHKTLPVLTGGAYLHISRSAPLILSEQAENALSIFASTSPSYLVLQSLDAANKYLADGYRECLAEFVKRVDILKEKLTSAGYELVGNESLKLTVSPKSYGYTGDELAYILMKQGIVCEFHDPDFAVMMLSPEIGSSGIDLLEKALLSFESKVPLSEKAPLLSKCEKVMSVRQACFMPSREEDVHSCLGKVLAAANVGCPPAIPIVLCGERIDEQAIRAFDYYGIKKCRIVDNDKI